MFFKPLETSHPAARTPPPFLLALLASFAACLPIELLRFHILRDRIVPLTYVLPLLLCLWHRDRRILWGMAAVFAGLSFVKIRWLMPDEAFGSDAMEWANVAMRWVNIAVGAAVVHGLIILLNNLDARHAALQHVNAELEARNQELAAREEELSSQNEELRSQGEELQEQAEELRQQTEQLQGASAEQEQQNELLQELNRELDRRQTAMQTLLESARWVRSDLEETEVVSQVCRAAVEAMGEDVCAAVVVEKRGNQLYVRGHWGFGEAGPVKRSWDYSRSLASLAMERGQTAFLPDLSLRPDLDFPQPASGPKLQSILVSPLRIEGEVVGAVEVFSQQPRQWTQEQFQIVEWLAVQKAIVLEAFSRQRELEQHRRAAEHSSDRKTRFLAAVSHDVRTPANAINLLAELLVRSADAGDVRHLPERARELQANAQSLVDLVSDVLDLARFDSGGADLSHTTFDLRQLLDAQMAQCRPLANAKGLRLLADGPESPIWLRTDRIKLARILGNLLGNAIKFTAAGSVELACGLGDDGSVVINVTDTGIGIPADQTERIFDEFYQLANPARDRSKGTGLGLAICRRLVRVLGGALSLRSQPGQGSEFTLTLPPTLIVPAPVDGWTASPPTGPRAANPLAGLHILLVEDHHATRRATAQLLQSEGAVVLEADSASAAFRLLAADGVQVVLLDMMLPDMDGREVLKAIGRERPSKLRCVLAVSGDVTASRKAEVAALGADGMVPKPIDIDELVRLLSAHAGGGASPAAIASLSQ